MERIARSTAAFVVLGSALGAYGCSIGSTTAIVGSKTGEDATGGSPSSSTVGSGGIGGGFTEPSPTFSEGTWSDGPAISVPESCGVPRDGVAALDSAGNVYVAWFQIISEAYLLHIAKYDLASGTWTTPVVLNPGADANAVSTGVSLATDELGNLLAVWEQGYVGTDSSLFTQIRANRWLTGKASPESSVVISSSAQEQVQFPSLSMTPDGVAIVGYINQVESRMETALFDGKTWSPPTLLASPPAQPTTPLGAASSGDGIAVAVQSYNTTVGAGASCFVPLASWGNGATWSSGVRTGPSSGCADFSGVGLDASGKGFLLTSVPSGPIYAQRFDGGLVGDAVVINGGASVSRFSGTLAVAKTGPAAASWAGGSDVFAAIAKDGVFAAAAPLESMSGTALSPVILVDDSANALAVWQQWQLDATQEATGAHLWSSTYDGTKWSAALRLDDDDANAIGYRVTVKRGPSGGAIVAYEQGGCLKIRSFR